MKNYYKLTAVIGCIMLCLLLMLSWSQAAVVPATVTDSPGWKRSIRIEWGYAPPLDVVVSEFVLYQDDVKVCTFPGKDITAGDCEITLNKTETAFTLTAKFTSGEETPKSSEFTFADFGPGPKIIILIGR